MVAQDVGSAIKGPERGDIYFGSGDAAGRLAGVTKHAGKFIVLLPNELPARAEAAPTSRRRRKPAMSRPAASPAVAVAPSPRTRPSSGSTRPARSIPSRPSRASALQRERTAARRQPQPRHRKPASSRRLPRVRRRATLRARQAKARPAPPLADFDRRKARQIASGKIEIDARIDLHGMRQRDARARLRAFLLDAHAAGHKTVLVITGKGGGERPADYLGALLGEQQRGVLKRSVPRWLEEPDLRAVVLSYTQAGPRHGGDGALYVQLRKRG